MTLATMRSLAADLRALGVGAGDVLLMHSSYKSLGYVAGGPQAVVQALLDVLGPDGTLVVPTQDSQNTDPADWSRPAVPRAWWEPIRHEAPGFDPALTPASPHMGRLAELVRTRPGALRSDHPQVSFAALGARAAEIVAGHQLADGLGESSPLGTIYRLDGKVLLLGAGHGSNTSLHLAEYRQDEPVRHQAGSSIRRPDGTSHWVTWTDVDHDADDFAALGEAFDATAATVTGPVGGSTARLMRQRALVDFGTGWLRDFRPAASAG